MIGVHIRWMIASDHPEVVEIAGCTTYPFGLRVLEAWLRRRDVIGLVALDLHQRVVGYAVYQLRPDQLVVLALGVGPYVRREGVGRAIVDRLWGKLRPRGRTRLVARVRETDDAGRRFWQAMGALALGVDRGRYPDTGEDAYVFELTAATAPSPSPALAFLRRAFRGGGEGDCAGKGGPHAADG